MRHVDQPTREIADLALAYRDDGVAGFDIAGAEKGFPPARFLESFQHLRRNNAVLHDPCRRGRRRGSPSGRPSRSAGPTGSATGWRSWTTSHRGPAARLGDFAAYVRNEQITLELCPSSNVQTGAAPSIAEHPFGRLADLGFRVTVNPDNRLMSGTTLTREFALLCEAFDYGLDDVRRFTLNAAGSVFAPYETRMELAERIIAA